MSKELEEFPKIKAIFAVLLTIITSGIYIPYWFLSRRKNLERCQIKLPYVAIKVTLLLSVFSILEPFWTSYSITFQREELLPYSNSILLLPLRPGHSFLPQLSFLLFWTINLVSAFKVRKSFMRFSKKPVNGFWTFILNVSYLQHITNQHSLVVQEKREVV
ncbi:DUF4234 domain-containing protein [Bacillus paralicheniformis]|uniref:DUF4234 domain-containing protein n=1 Tax=Bacillus paralicheniformis TaxID=1648923 RepID=UPI00228027B6|nr:DUF4234 domain-containing protein [Bacillus paralicheniformis]MCY8151201.1 DUF4234 domain-containing protein [Bacillus paralicheniformis]MCY9420525.1 DUF4234 domain-containing protein [Bacillus paralicheniformis]MEC0576542.1 DUF4234 domain-containing protein [Bacillus paralicheniformis]